MDNISPWYKSKLRSTTASVAPNDLDIFLQDNIYLYTLLLIKTKVKGNEDSKINNNAGAAASAKNASVEYDQTIVDNVLKSNGDRIKTAGNSFIVTRNTITAPINIPDLNIGIVTLNIVLNLPFPRVLDESSGFGLNSSMVDLMGPIPVGM